MSLGETGISRLRGISRVREVVRRARDEGRRRLLETEALRVVEACGVSVPRFAQVESADQAARLDLSPFPGEAVWVKALAEELVHKSEAGAVTRVPRESPAVAEAVAAMCRRLAGQPVAGYGVFEEVPHDSSLGGELLLGLRFTRDFGPVLSLGPGGIFAEPLAEALGASATAILSPDWASPEDLDRAFSGKLLTPILAGGLRGQAAKISRDDLHRLFAAFLDLAREAVPEILLELEINPLVLTRRGPVALDAKARLGEAVTSSPRPQVPAAAFEALLRPQSLAVVGVSRRPNPGRIALMNLLAQGYDPRAVRVVKPGVESVEGCPAFPDLASLPEPVDLLVVALDAVRALELVEEVTASGKARSLILFSGGLGEAPGSEDRAKRLAAILEGSRCAGEPLAVNGPNSLGVRSLPGRYDTLFIPREKLSYPDREETPLALVSQSGAFAVARGSKLAGLNPRYVISLGNQLGLTAGDYLGYLAQDPGVEVAAFYLEGFRPGDGLRFLENARRMRNEGRRVVLYRAGRTPEGIRATASHTASVAGDYPVTRELAEAAGVVVVETLEELEDVVRLLALLRDHPRLSAARRLGAISNAGFECVAVADHSGPFSLATWSETTRQGLQELLADKGLADLVAPTNPLDVTPMADDEAFARAARLVLEDEGVEVGVVGCVPLTGALATLEAGRREGEDRSDLGSVLCRLAALRREVRKPWVAVVDAGELYDPFARGLEAAAIPTFRTMDRALRALARLLVRP